MQHFFQTPAAAIKPAVKTINAKDFGCIGDSVTINDSAITALFKYAHSIGGAHIIFPAGTYRIAALHNTPDYREYILLVPANSTIEAYKATFESDHNFAFRFLNSNNTSWLGGTIIKGRMDIRASGISIEDVTIKNSWIHSFHLNGGNFNERDSLLTKVYTNIVFKNCVSLNSNRHGFTIHHGTGAGFKLGDSLSYVGYFKHVRYINCKAIHPGSDNTATYDYAFGIEDCKGVADIVYENCYAFKAPSAGYHVENHVTIQGGVTLKNCVADSCGQTSSSASYPFGFMYKDGYTLINCHGKGNRGGTFAHLNFAGGNYSFINCYTDGYSPFTYVPGTTKEYTLKPESFGGISGNAAYVTGASTFTIRGMNPAYFAVDSANEVDGATDKKCIKYIYNKSAVYTNDRVASITSVPIKVDPLQQYQITVTAKQLSGLTGNLTLYVQEYDKDYKLIGRVAALPDGYTYMLKGIMPDIATNKFTTYTFYIGKGVTAQSNPASATIPSGDVAFDKNTVWIKASVVFTDAPAADKIFALSDFSITPK